MRWMFGTLLALILTARTALGCELALVLAVDISGSVDRREYDVQMQGLAGALRDGQVIDALVSTKAALLVMQWTGSSRQRVSVPWTRINDAADVLALSETVAATPRAWRNFSTAIGEALLSAQASFQDVPDCTNRIIDVSGDGTSNEGVEPRYLRRSLNTDGIIVNGLVIEDATAEDLTGYFFENVITGPGAFVMTANGFDDYPDRIRDKLRRETVDQISQLVRP